MEDNKRLILYKTVFITIIYMIYLYFIAMYYYRIEMIQINEINHFNLAVRIIQDIALGLFAPFILILIYRKDLSRLGFSNKNMALSFILLMAYLISFILQDNYSLVGIYRALYYLIVVAFSEEVIMRGYLYLRLRAVNKKLAILLTGIIFGAVHAILPGVRENLSITSIILDMGNHIGGGIVATIMFISLMELSGNILVAILIHALLDYSFNDLGTIIMLTTLCYLLLKKYRYSRMK